MAAKSKCRPIDIEEMRRRLDYNPDTGDLTWKFFAPLAPSDRKAANRVNHILKGKVAGKIRERPKGYFFKVVKINGDDILAHRLCWAIMTGDQPPDCIDHINGDGADNRWSNLRAGIDGVNEKNQRLHSNNTSGVCGVTWSKQSKKWQAYITCRRKRFYLGLFDELDDAKAAREKAEKAFGFSGGHGKPQAIRQVHMNLSVDSQEKAA